MTPRRRRTSQLIQDYVESFSKECFSFSRFACTRVLVERCEDLNECWWRDVKTYRSEDVPRRVKCRRMVEHIHSVFCLGANIGPGVVPMWTELKDGKRRR